MLKNLMTIGHAEKKASYLFFTFFKMFLQKLSSCCLCNYGYQICLNYSFTSDHFVMPHKKKQHYFEEKKISFNFSKNMVGIFCATCTVTGYSCFKYVYRLFWNLKSPDGFNEPFLGHDVRDIHTLCRNGRVISPYVTAQDRTLLENTNCDSKKPILKSTKKITNRWTCVILPLPNLFISTTSISPVYSSHSLMGLKVNFFGLFFRISPSESQHLTTLLLMSTTNRFPSRVSERSCTKGSFCS